MLKRVLTVAVIAVVWPIVWVIGQLDEATLYDEYEREDWDGEPTDFPSWETEEPNDDE
jgi:hypothetical protein